MRSHEKRETRSAARTGSGPGCRPTNCASLPRRTTGTCAEHQRQLTVAIKRARQIALLPYVAD